MECVSHNDASTSGSGVTPAGRHRFAGGPAHSRNVGIYPLSLWGRRIARPPESSAGYGRFRREVGIFKASSPGIITGIPSGELAGTTQRLAGWVRDCGE